MKEINAPFTKKQNLLRQRKLSWTYNLLMETFFVVLSLDVQSGSSEKIWPLRGFFTVLVLLMPRISILINTPLQNVSFFVPPTRRSNMATTLYQSVPIKQAPQRLHGFWNWLKERLPSASRAKHCCGFYRTVNEPNSVVDFQLEHRFLLCWWFPQV